MTCQQGAETALKDEIGREWPAWRFSYSRPGFATFKLPPVIPLPDDFDLRSVFARAYGISQSRVSPNEPDALEKLWQAARELNARRLHVWERDSAPAGDHGYEPGLTEIALAARETILAARPADWEFHADPIAEPGEVALDCVLVRPDEWWLGYHRSSAGPSCLPGGFWQIELPAHVVSRAYLKMEEAIRWSRFPLKSGQRVAEIGSSPGGASQSLLERGLFVIGIDPAEMHPDVLAQPHFTHLRKRGHETRRREFRDVDWLTADINVAPSYTLDTVEAIVTHPEVNIRGLLLTLKLLSWDLAAEIPSYLDRVRSWGYHDVRCRQLQYNRQEICVAALA